MNLIIDLSQKSSIELKQKQQQALIAAKNCL